MQQKNLFILIMASVLALLAVLFLSKFGGAKKDISDKISSGAVSHQLTDAASYSAAEGNYSLKITKVFETSPKPIEKTDAPTAKKVVVVLYEYTNEDVKKGLVISKAHFKAFDKHGKELMAYPQQGLFEANSVAASGTMTASLAFALNSDDKYMEIDYYNDVSSANPNAVYTETW